MTNVKTIRLSKKISLYYIAKHTKLSYSALVAIEKGGDLRVSTLYKIAKALEINPSELLLSEEKGDRN